MANRFLNNIRINDSYTLPSADGSVNQVITTDGAGNLSFIDVNSVIDTATGEVYYTVKNSTGSTLSKGKAVMAVGSDGNSGHILVDEMIADGSIEPKYFLGVLAEDIGNGNTGKAIHFGQIDQFDTRGQNGETWNDGDILWCDPDSDGDFTITEPDGPNVKIAAAIVLNSATNGKIQVRVQANEGIHDLHDTKIVNQVDGDILVWDNTTGVWFNDSTLNVDQGVGVDITGNLDVSGKGEFGNNKIRITNEGNNALLQSLDTGLILRGNNGFTTIQNGSGSNLAQFDDAQIDFWKNVDITGDLDVSGTGTFASIILDGATTYLRPNTNGTQTLNIGGNGAGIVDWNQIRVYTNGSNDFLWNSEIVATQDWVTTQVQTVDTLDEVTQNANWTEQGIVVRDSIIKVGSSTGTNQVDSGTIDFLEDTDNDFGAVGGYGFRLNYNGDTNDFSLQAGSETSVDTVFTVDRGSSASFIFNRSVDINGSLDVTSNLDVSGTSTFNDNVVFANNKELRWKDSGGTERTIIELTSLNDLVIGGSYSGSTVFMGGGSYTERGRITNTGDWDFKSKVELTKNTSVLLELARNDGGSENMNIKFRGSSGTRNLGKTSDNELRWGSSDDASLNDIIATQNWVTSQIQTVDTLQEVTDNGNTTNQGIDITANGLSVVGGITSTSGNFDYSGNGNLRFGYDSSQGGTSRTLFYSGGIAGNNEVLILENNKDVTIPNGNLDVSGNLTLNNTKELRFKNTANNAVGVMTLYSDNTLRIFNGNSTSGNIEFRDGSAIGTLNASIRGSDGKFLANFGADITGNLDVSGVLRTDEVRTLSAQQLVLNAGESHAYATGQTGEYVYINAEKGLFIASSPDNWATAWANRTTGVMGTLGNSDGKLRLGSNSADNILLIRGGSTKAEITSTGIDVTGDLTVSNSTVAQLYLDSATGNDSAIYHRENSVQVAKTGYDTSEDVWAVVAGGGAFSTAQLKVDTNGVDITGNLDVSGSGTFGDDITIPNNTSVIAPNSTGSETSQLIGTTGSNGLVIGQNARWASTGIYSGGLGYTLEMDSSKNSTFNGNLDVSGIVAIGSTPALEGTLRFSNNQSIAWRNFANTNSVHALKVDTDNNIVIGDDTFNTDIKLIEDTYITGDLDISGTGAFSDTVSITTSGVTTSINGNTISMNRDSANYLNASNASGYWAINVAGNTGINNALLLRTNLKLQTPGDLEANGQLTATTTSGQSHTFISERDAPVAIESSDATTGIEFVDTDGSNFLFYSGSSDTYNFSGSDVTNVGSIGIGTTTPSAKLNIVDSNPKIVLEDSDNAGTFGQIRQQAGNLQFLSNNNTSNGTIQFNLYDGTSTTEAMRIDSDGDVGIGTISPSEKLEVDGNVRLSTTGDKLQFANNNVGVYRESGSILTLGGYGGIHFNAEGVSGIQNQSTRMVISDGGNVGIGTTSPGYPLEIAGTSTVSLAYQRTGVSAKKWGFHSDNSNTYWQNLTDNILAFTLSNAGNVGIGTTSPDSLLELENSPAAQTQSRMLHIDNNPSSNQGSGYIEISSGTNSQAKTQIEQVSSGGYGLLGNQYIDTNIINRGLSSSPYGNINFATGSSTSATSIVMTIGGGSQKGNVGIGTTSPGDKLQVAGNAIIQDYAYIGDGVQHWGDGGTGMNFPANDTIDLATSSTSRIRINSSGNVGIGTTSPAKKLEVDGTVHLGSSGNDVSIGASNSSVIFMLRSGYNYIQASDASGALMFRTGGANNRMIIDSSGNVGIGLTNPSVTLHVDGFARLNGGLQLNTSNAQIYQIQNSDLRFGTNNTERMRIDSSGNVGIGTTTPTSQLEIESTSDNMFRLNRTGVREYRQGISTSGSWQITDITAGLDRITLNNTGNFGIGTTTPTEKLDVLGDTRLNGLVGINTVPNTKYQLNMQFDNTNADDDFHFAQRIDGNFSGADNTTADREQGGIYIDIDSSADGDATNEHRIYGIYSDVRFTGFSDVAYGTFNRLESNNSTESTSNMAAAYNYTIHDSSSSGGVSNLYGSLNYGVLDDAGSVINAYGSASIATTGAGRTANAGNLTGALGEVQIDSPNAIAYEDVTGVEAVIDNNEGTNPTGTNTYLFKGSYQGTRYATNAYGIYVQGDKHYLEGNVGIGTTSPSGKLHIAPNGYSNYVFTGDSTSGYTTTFHMDNTGLDIGHNSTGRKLNLKTGSLDRLTILGNGNVGIGTTSPEGRFEVQTIDSNRYIRFKAPNGEQRFQFYTGGTGNPAAQYMYNSDGTTRNVQIHAGGISYFNGGNVGIGTTNPAKTLHISDGTNDTPTTFRIENTDTSIQTAQEVNSIEFYTNDSSASGTGVTTKIAQVAENAGNQYGLAFSTYNLGLSEAMRIDEAGNVGIGTTTPGATLHTVQTLTEAEGLRVDGASGGFALLVQGGTSYKTSMRNASIGNNYASSNAPANGLIVEGNVGIGTTSPVFKLDVHNSGSGIRHYGDSNNQLETFCYGSYQTLIATNGSVTNEFGYVGGNFYIQTNDEEKFRITSSGNVGVGTTSPSSRLHVAQTLSSSSVPMVYFEADSSTYTTTNVRVDNVEYGAGMSFYRAATYDNKAIAFINGTTQVGSISINTSSTSYNTTSDYRLKENLTEITDGIERVKQLQPKRFNFIGDTDTVDGFIAHEAQEVVPEAVTGEKDGVLPNGDPIYQGIDQAKLVPLLTAALQEAITKIEQLETRIQTLENK